MVWSALIGPVIGVSFERRTFDIAFLLITGGKGSPREALAWRFAAGLAVADRFVLTGRLVGFARLRHALTTLTQPRRSMAKRRPKLKLLSEDQDFFLRERRLRERLLPFFGTFLPLRRASERPIAIACFLLFTFLPLRPLRSLPDLRFFIALRTSLLADFEYFRAIENPLRCSSKEKQT
jgi:hypothetical protein